jgi:hypothetical protein
VETSSTSDAEIWIGSHFCPWICVRFPPFLDIVRLEKCTDQID